MRGESPLTDGMARLMGVGSKWMEEYGGHIKDVTSKMDSGDYQVSDAGNDLTKCMKGAFEGMGMWLEAVSAVAADCYQSYDSVLLKAPSGLARPVDLEVVEITGAWGDSLGSDRVSLNPSRLNSSNDTTFEMVLDDKPIPPDEYTIKVRFKPSSGTPVIKPYTLRFP